MANDVDLSVMESLCRQAYNTFHEEMVEKMETILESTLTNIIEKQFMPKVTQLVQSVIPQIVSSETYTLIARVAVKEVRQELTLHNKHIGKKFSVFTS